MVVSFTNSVCSDASANNMRVLVILFFITLSVAADEDGGYSSDNSGQYVPSDEGRYIPDDSGRYVPDGLGGYILDGSGRYGPDGSGKYRGVNEGLNGNLLGSSSQQKNIVRPAPTRFVEVKVPVRQIPVISTTLKPIPLKTYSNSQEGKWRIIHQLADLDTDGYHWEYDTENKIVAEESGKLHNVGTENEVMKAKGFFEYVGPDNVLYRVDYTADENGFVPIGKHLPTPPPIPADIAKTLQN